MQKKILQKIIFVIFWDSLMFYQIFLSPLGKLCEIITNKHGIYDFLHELSKHFRLQEELGCKNENVVNTG